MERGKMKVAIPFLIREITYDIAEGKSQQWVMRDGVHLSNEDAISELRVLLGKGIDVVSLGE